MLCGCIRFTSKPKAVSNGLEFPSTLEELAISESKRRSWAPSPPERVETGIGGLESIVTPAREVVMEPSVESRFQVLGRID